MNNDFEALQAGSLKDKFVRHIEESIISGRLSIGEQLQPEREIAADLKISRTIVHSGLIELAAKGLITVNPRKGTYVNDYRNEGTITILESLINYSGEINGRLLDSILAVRYLIETENARLAALNRGDDDLLVLKNILEAEDKADRECVEDVADIDFNFHHQVAMATKNIVYPLLIKSFEGTYKNLTRKFFKKAFVVPVVFEYHRELFLAIKEHSSEKAESVMKEVLKHGEEHLKY
jgi:DNA-binding FadR family transcriptional regulator